MKIYTEDVIKMNKREQHLVDMIKVIILNAWNGGKELSISEITEELNHMLKEFGYPTEINPKQVGVYIRKYLGLETEIRGHDKRYYPVLTPDIIKEL